MTLPESIAGTFDWTDETLTFNPASPLPAGKTLVFHLDRTAKKSDGSTLGQDLDFTFTVAGPPLIAGRIPEVGAQDVSETSKSPSSSTGP